MWFSVVLALQVATLATVPPRLVTLQAWIAAVEQHAPEAIDPAFSRVRRMAAAELHAIRRDLGSVLALVKDPRLNRFVLEPDPGSPNVRATITYTYEELDALRTFARDIRERGGANWLLKRATGLHTDLAILSPPTRTDAPQAPVSGLRQVSAALSDGQQIGFNDSVGHWEMGRRLLDLVTPPPPKDTRPHPGGDDDVRLWYRATASYMLAGRIYPLPHFARAIELFPADAPLLFMAGSLHESLSSSPIQVATRSTNLGALGIRLGSERDELVIAEALFRRALTVDPAFVDARIRWAHVLGRLGRTADAVRELRRSEENATEPLLRYLTSLFLGQQLTALKEIDAARAAYEQAAALFPRAAAPQLGLSFLDLQSGNRAAARASADHAFAGESRDDSDDPWWNYYMASGRSSETLIAAMRKALIR